MAHEITVKHVAAQPVAAVRTHTSLATIGPAVQAGFGSLMAYLAKAGVDPAAAPLVVYHDVIDRETSGDVEICIPVARSVAGEGEVYGAELPAADVATTVHQGAYAELGHVYQTLADWIQGQGHEVAGPPREIYLNDPRTVAEEELLTEIDWPIRAA